jgi:hypothetical protein
MHQIETLHLGCGDRRETDRARIVDDDIDATEDFGGSRDRRLDGLLVAHIDHEGQRPASGLDDFGSRAVDRAGQFYMGRVGLGSDGDIGAVARGAQTDGKPDAARCASDEKCLSLQRQWPRNSRRRRLKCGSA